MRTRSSRAEAAIWIGLIALGCWTPPTVRWSDGFYAIQSSCRPVSDPPFGVYDGTFYQTREGRQLRARSAADGSTRWTVEFGDDCVLTYAVHAGFIGAALSRGGHPPSETSSVVIGVDAREGRHQWSTPIRAYPLGGLPGLDAQAVYVATRRHRHTLLGAGNRTPDPYDPDHRLRAFDRRTGAPLWSQPIPTPEGYSPIGWSHILPHDRRVFVLSGFASDRRPGVSAYDARTGVPLWKSWIEPVGERPLHRSSAARQIALLSDGRLVIFYLTAIGIHDPRTGALVHVPPLAPETQRVYEGANSLLVHDDALYLFSLPADTALRLELPSGEERWRRKFSEKRDWKGISEGWLPVAWGEGRVALGAEDGNIYVLGAEDGRLIGSVDPHRHMRLGGMGAHPAIPYAGGVFVGAGIYELRRPWIRR